jgi:hypothetical protein
MWKERPTLPHGILCGTDSDQEWLLPWWWSRLKDHNDLPVTFCDFGMSAEARLWCEERGAVIDVVLDPLLIVAQEKIPPELIEKWESIYGPAVWKARGSWFKKPLALLSTPYLKTIWIDLDCEILASLLELFETCNSDLPIALVREPISSHLPRFHPDIKYNSGVIAYQHGASFIEMWSDEAVRSNHLFWGDDPLLSHLISKERYEVNEISEIWNWRMNYGFCMNAKIYHWVGSGGKGFIRERGGIKPALDSFFAACGKAKG